VYTVHGPCTAIYTVRTRSGTAAYPAVFCHVPAAYTAVFVSRDGPYAWPAYGRVHSFYTAEGGRAQSVHGHPRPCTDCVQGRAQAMYMVRP